MRKRRASVFIDMTAGSYYNSHRSEGIIHAVPIHTPVSTPAMLTKV